MRDGGDGSRSSRVCSSTLLRSRMPRMWLSVLVRGDAVAVLKSGIIIGHLPRKISTLCSIFLRRGGSIHCVTGRRRYSSDLPQGGMEIPCSLHFKGAAKDMKKVKKPFQSQK